MTKNPVMQTTTEVEIETPSNPSPKVEVSDSSVELEERDEFCSSEFLDPDAKLPRIQALRGTTETTCGYFVNVTQMAIAGWREFEENQLITYNFESTASKEQGILIANPRMLVCPKTPVLGFDKKQSKENNSTVIIGRYNAEMREDENIGNIQYFQVFLLNQENQPLHQIPFIYKAKGANQASFAAHWQEFCNELNICHSIVNGIPAKQKNALFNSLGIFCFKTARELVGNKNKSFTCRVVEHEKPTVESWCKYFIGFNPKTKAYIWESLEPSQSLIIPGFSENLVPALPAATTNNLNTNESSTTAITR